MLKPNGLLLVMGRGASVVSLYNQFLQFRAGLDIQREGCVYHLDIEQIVRQDPQLEIEHHERRNLGMTFVIMARKKPSLTQIS